MGLVEVNDFARGLGKNRAYRNVSVSVYACSCVPLGISCVSVWGGGCYKFVKEVRAKKEKVSLSEENKRDWKSAIIVLEITKWER